MVTVSEAVPLGACHCTTSNNAKRVLYKASVYSRHFGTIFVVLLAYICIFQMILVVDATKTTPDGRRIRYIKCVSQKGHIDHYYHFLYACLVPIAVFKSQIKHPLNSRKLDPQLVLCESNVGSLQNKLSAVFPGLQYLNECPESPRVLEAYDHNYGAGIVELKNSSRSAVIKQLYESVPADILPPSPIKILLIGRGNTNAGGKGTKNIRDETQTSGAQRRSIPNLPQLERSLRDTFGTKNIATTYLENLGIHEQFYLFRSASIVIAQHGAALANILFMHPTSKGVVEISPYNTTHYMGKFTHALPNCFRFAAFSARIPYLSVRQATEFSPVDIKEVITAVKTMIRS
jgi:hypothetical protein